MKQLKKKGGDKMATEQALQIITLPAAGDLSSYQYCFVSIDSNGRVALTSAGAQADGVLQNKPAALGRAAEIAISGVTKLLCGGTVTKGALIAATTNGKGLDATSGDNISAVSADTAAGSNGTIISALLKTQNANAIA